MRGARGAATVRLPAPSLSSRARQQESFAGLPRSTKLAQASSARFCYTPSHLACSTATCLRLTMIWSDNHLKSFCSPAVEIRMYL